MEYILGAGVVLGVLAFVVLPLVQNRSVASDVGDTPDSTQERAAIYRELLELELDLKVGKLADADYHELSAALLARAAALISQQDAAATALDTLVEREIAEARVALRQAAASPAESAPSPTESTPAEESRA